MNDTDFIICFFKQLCNAIYSCWLFIRMAHEIFFFFKFIPIGILCLSFMAGKKAIDKYLLSPDQLHIESRTSKKYLHDFVSLLRNNRGIHALVQNEVATVRMMGTVPVCTMVCCTASIQSIELENYGYLFSCLKDYCHLMKTLESLVLLIKFHRLDIIPLM